jgi:hypothetical protein
MQCLANDLKYLFIDDVTSRKIIREVHSNRRWSVRQDSNLRPLGPKPSALPSCATHRLNTKGHIVIHKNT